VKTYVILRRGGWRTAEDVRELAGSSTAEVDAPADEVSWIRSYVLTELDGSVGTVCVYRAASPEAIRAHAEREDLPVDEIVAVGDTVVVRPDPVEATA
jgi:sporulation protein YlmC with PRC-barrel domain